VVQNSKNGRISVPLKLEDSSAIKVRGTATLRKVMNLGKASPSVAEAGTTRESFAKKCSDVHEIALIRDRI